MESALKNIGWSSCSSGAHAFPFTVEDKEITASPVGAEGPGWESRIDGPQSVGYLQQTYTYGDPSEHIHLCSPFLVGLGEGFFEAKE